MDERGNVIDSIEATTGQETQGHEAKPQGSGISKTAYYCCGIRMLDAESRNPICNDIYARDFMGEEGLEVFRTLTKFGFAGNRARPRIIDDLIRDELRLVKDLQVVLIGAGFDSRAYRLPGGDWIEIDEAAIIRHKNRQLPADQCPNPLRRVAVDFGTDDLSKVLAGLPSDRPTVFIVEGVLMYLEKQQIDGLLSTLRSFFPEHKLFCDLMSPRFVSLYARIARSKFAKMGADFTNGRFDQKALILGQSYRVADQISVLERAIELGVMKLPLFVIGNLLKSAQEYSVYSLTYGSVGEA